MRPAPAFRARRQWGRAVLAAIARREWLLQLLVLGAAGCRRADRAPSLPGDEIDRGAGRVQNGRSATCRSGAAAAWWPSRRRLADEWVQLPNNNLIFAGQTPLAFMMRGGLPAMQTVRRLLDARRAG